MAYPAPACLGSPMDRGAWETTVHRVAELDTTEWLNHHLLPEPLQGVTEHWVELFTSYSKFPLAIYFTCGNVYASMLLSISPTLSFPHCVHRSVLCVRTSTAALQRASSVHPYPLSRSPIYTLIYYICFSLSGLLHSV